MGSTQSQDADRLGADLMADFKDAMAALAAGVCLVTTSDERCRPVGFAASSVTSVSLGPPMLLVCQAKTSGSYPVFTECGTFAVNVLGAQQRELADRFATPGAARFTDTGFVQREEPGAPVHPEALARLLCRRTRTIDAGDHAIILGEVCEAEVTAGDPLVYQQRRFQRVMPQARSGDGA